MNQVFSGRGLLETLSAIEALSLLETEEVGHLRDAYLFLRGLENLLQRWATSKPRPYLTTSKSNYS